VEPLRQQMARVIVGQEELIDRLMVGLISNGHILLEGVPGLAKTLALKTLASAIGLHFQRLQFTPDMLPADIVGTMIYNPRDGSFSTKHGPVFSNLILRTRSIARPPRCKAHCSKRCRNVRSRSAMKRIVCRIRFLSRNAKPARAGRHLSAAGSQVDRFYDEGDRRLPESHGRARHSRRHGCD
jgi:MoxR-like ATPases